jgi:prepilin-type N-terminal cleavage/methylation domain-containing protein
MSRILRLKSSNRQTGFSLIELAIVLAVVAILASVAIPSYQLYIRRGYLSEAKTTMALIQSSLQAYYDADNDCFTSAPAHPASVPKGTPVAWDPAPAAWGPGRLNLKPDRFVRFQYEVLASNTFDPAKACGAPVDRTTLGSLGCVSASDISTKILDPKLFPKDWYIIVARGDLDSDGQTSTLLQTMRNTNMITCDELE